MNRDEALAFLNPSQGNQLGTPAQPESMSPDEKGPQLAPQSRATGMSQEDALAFLGIGQQQKAPIPDSAYLNAPAPEPDLPPSDPNNLTSNYTQSVPQATPQNANQKPQGMSREDALAFLGASQFPAPEQTGKVINLPAYNPIENALRNFASTAATSTLNSIGGAVRYFGGAQQKDLKMAQDELAQATSSGASQDQIDEIQGRIDKFKQEIPQVQDAAKSLSDLSSQYPIAYGVNPQDRSISAQIGRGLGSATSMIPTMATGPAGMALGPLQGASQAYEDTYQNAKQTLQSQGMTDESAINEQAQRQASEAAVKTAPALAAYLVGGKLASAGVSKLLSTQTPLIQGIAGTIAGSVANTAAGSTIRKIMGESAMPTPESLTQDIAFGLFHGIGTGVEAQEKLRQEQEIKAKQDAAVGGPAPSVAPSANPVVNEREAKINAMANEQAPIPEAPRPVEVAPNVETPAAEVPAKPELSNEEKLNQLFNEQWLHEEGSPEHTAIQQQIDQLKSGEAPAPVEVTIKEQPAEAPAEAQPTTENAVQEPSAREVGVRNAPAVGEGVGRQNKPEVPAEEGKVTKEEVPIITENTRTISRQYGNYPKGTNVEIIGEKSKDPLDQNIRVRFPDGKEEKFPIVWLKKPKGQIATPKESLPQLVNRLGRDGVNELLAEWQDAELSPDGKYIMGVIDPRSSMRLERVPVKEFLDWVQQKESTEQKPEVPTEEGQAPKEEVRPIEAIHYSHKPMALTKEGYKGIGYGEEPTFGKGLYAMLPESEKTWKSMDRLVLGKNRNEITIDAKNPLIITPDNVIYLYNQAKSKLRNNINEFKFENWLKEKSKKDGNDAIFVKGFFEKYPYELRDENYKKTEKIIRQNWTPKFEEGRTEGSFLNGDELDKANKKAIMEVWGVSPDERNIILAMQDQIYVSPENSDIVTRKGGKEEVVVPVSLEEAKTPEEVDAFVKSEREKLKSRFRTDTDNAKINSRNKESIGKKSKALGMQAAAKKRQITGQLTAKEQAAKDKREASNYVGKPVSVDGENGIIIGNAFGRVKVRFSDGTESTHLPEKIESPSEPKPTTPTIETNGEGNLFKEKDLPFNLAGEELPPEPEKKTTGTEEEQQLPMGEQKPPNPYRELLHRFYHEIRTHGDFANAVQDLAKKEKNKHLQAAADKFLEEMQVGEEPNVEALLSSIEIEANDHDNPPELTPKTKRITREIQGGYLGIDPVMAYLQENPIMSKSEYLRRVKKGEFKKGGGDYNDAPTINAGHSMQIYSPEGEHVSNVVQALVDLGKMPEGSKPSDLWKHIEEQSKSASSRQTEEGSFDEREKRAIQRAQEIEKLRNDNPELFEQERNEELKDWFDSHRFRQSGFTEFPRIIYDGIVEVASSLKKAGKSFTDWSKDMVGKFGEGVRNYLRQIYNAISTGGGRFTERGAERGAIDIGGDERFKPKPPTEQEAFAKKVYDTSVSQRGKPPSQEEMTNILSRKFPGITSREVSDLYATATGKPKPSVEYKPSFTAPESTTSEQFTTGLKKATVAQERLARGLEDIPQEERQAEEEKVARAVERVKNDPSVAPSIVSRILEEKNPAITSEDAAALLVERNQLMNERRVWERILDDENKSPAERGNAQEQVNSIETQLERLDRAQRATGSEWGRLGHLYQRMMREDYSLENMETRARRALGRPLDKSERDSIKKQSEEIQKASEELEKAQEKAQNAQEKEDIAKTYWKTIQELKAELDQRPKVEPQIKRIIDRIGVKLKEKAKASEEALARIRKEGRFNVGLDPEILYHHAVIGADMIYEGATDIAKFTNRMVEKFGDYVLPHIKDIFAASQKEYDKTTDSEAGIKSPEVKEKAPKVEKTIGEIKATGKAEKVANPFLPGLEHLQDPLTHKLVYELARQHILEGVRGEDNVMKAVHDDIKDVYPDATERDVRRAFSEYGKAKFPSKDADRVALAELRTLTRLQESIDRLNENLPALKTGLQRNKATQDIREKTAKLNELLKKVKLPPTEEQLASRDAAKQTALKNRIADIDKQLRTGEKLKRSASEPDSPETENLRLEKIAMEQLLKEVTNEAKPKKSPEEAYNERRQKAIDKKMAEIQERLRTNNYEKSPRRIPPAKNEETQRKELALKKLQNDYERKLLKYQEENKPRWAKILQGTSEAAKGLAITGYHSLEKILGFDIAKLVTTPIEEFTGSAVSMLPGMKQREGMLESGGSTIGGLIKYYKGLVKGAR